jgi:hypothetical protein
MSFFGDMMTMFSGGDKPNVQTPQVATTAAEPLPTGRTEPQSEAEMASIKAAEDDERRRQMDKKGQGSTILTGSLGTPAEDGAAQRKTLLGA